MYQTFRLFILAATLSVTAACDSIWETDNPPGPSAVSIWETDNPPRR